MYTSDDILDAMMARNRKKLLEIISSGEVNLDKPDEYGCTSLHWAAYLGNYSAIKILIDARANVHAKNHTGETPLHFAAHSRQLGAIKSLKYHGANVDEVDNYGITPLFRVATTHKCHWNSNCIRILKELKGTNLDVKGPRDWTALHWATYNNLEDAVEFLVKSGANIEERNDEGNTPIRYSMGYRDYKAFDVLFKAGADINSKNNYGEALLHLRAKCGSYDDMSYLIKCGANIEITDNSGRTPLGIILDQIKYTKSVKYKLKLLAIETVIEVIDSVLYRTPTSDSFRKEIAELKSAYKGLSIISDTYMEGEVIFGSAEAAIDLEIQNLELGGVADCTT